MVINGVMNNEQNIIISDTDSLYICLGPILEHMKSQGIEINESNKNNIILSIANVIQEDANKNLNIICREIFNINPDTHYFQLKQEVICAGVLTTGKRRYAMYVTNKEGVPVEELDMKGLELMKSNMNKLFKSFGEQLIKNILFGKNKVDIDTDIIEFYKTLKTLDPRQLGKPMGVKHMGSYYIPPRAGEMFSSFKTGAPANTKAAVRYNDLLRFKKLDTKFESIIEGDKIFIINLKPNVYKLETIGLPNAKVPDEIEKFVKEFIDIDEIFESLLLNKLKELYKDLSWQFPALNENIGRFFKF